ncbi:uncharacterized protein METZ01_LOCUS467245, partial [marine metagenome]
MPDLVWMDVVHVEVRIRRHPFEQEGNKCCLIGLCQPRIDRGKGVGVRGTEIGRDQHTGDHERSQRVFRFHSIENRLQILTCRGQRDATQTVVAAELQY